MHRLAQIDCDLKVSPFGFGKFMMKLFFFFCYNKPLE